jgi:GTP-binding protein
VISAGNGGDGCVSFYRYLHGCKYPVGGNGGKGGDVFFQGNSKMNSLYELRRAHLSATPGKSGRSDKQDGGQGGKALFRVPLGTVVYELKELTSLLKEGMLKNFGIRQLFNQPRSKKQNYHSGNQ